VKHLNPADIEATSMALIGQELEQMKITLPPENEAVVKRVIHTSADFDFAETLHFTDGAVAAGVAALKNGVPIITDTNMALSGIRKSALAQLQTEAHCYMADPDIAESARAQGTTRAAASMQKAARTAPNAIFAIGNGPTALLELSRLIEEREVRPSLVIGVPVGFVNVVESKETIWNTCLAHDIPAIVAMGRKGGSTIATAICNALLYTATDQLDPHNRT